MGTAMWSIIILTVTMMEVIAADELVWTTVQQNSVTINVGEKILTIASILTLDAITACMELANK